MEGLFLETITYFLLFSDMKKAPLTALAFGTIPFFLIVVALDLGLQRILKHSIFPRYLLPIIDLLEGPGPVMADIPLGCEVAIFVDCRCLAVFLIIKIEPCSTGQ